MQLQTLFDNTSAGQGCRQAVHDDMVSARMSRAFRLYYRLRPLIPLAIRQRLQRNRNRRIDVADQWYFPTRYFSMVEASFGSESFDLLHPWPAPHQFCFALTHDVETSDGMRGVAALAEIEEELGFRSSWNLVPYKYPIDHGLVRDLQERGFEIGVHGYNHDGKLFWSESIFRRRVVAINRALQDLNAVGFRAPMVHRNLDWLQSLNIEYDASCFDVDPFQAMPGGIGSIWPAIVGKFVELPYTLPQDHTLFVTLGEQTTSIWQEKLAYIKRRSGMALMLTHPDYLDSPKLRSLYGDFLKQVRDEGMYWHALPREVARWWRKYSEAAAIITAKGHANTTLTDEGVFTHARLSCREGVVLFEAVSEAATRK